MKNRLPEAESTLFDDVLFYLHVFNAHVDDPHTLSAREIRVIILLHI